MKQNKEVNRLHEQTKLDIFCQLVSHLEIITGHGFQFVYFDSDNYAICSGLCADFPLSPAWGFARTSLWRRGRGNVTEGGGGGKLMSDRKMQMQVLIGY